jgi:hypothetical protein
MTSREETRRAISPPIREIFREGPGTLVLMVFWALALLGPPIVIGMAARQLGTTFGTETAVGLIGLVINLTALVWLSRWFFGR